MRVTRVEQTQPKKHSGIAKAGLIGAAGGALVRNIAPLTKSEHDTFFNSSALNAIKSKASKVRSNEAHKIIEEIADNRLQVSREAADIFSQHASTIALKPESAGDFFKSSSDAVKEEAGKLIKRVVSVGAVKEHTEITNIKNAAKQSRPLAYFVAIGAIAAMTGQIIKNAFVDLMPEKKVEKKEDNLTMADVLLEGLGSNTEVLFLTNSSKK